MNRKGQAEYISEFIVSLVLIIVTIIIIGLTTHNERVAGNKIEGITIERAGIMDLINYVKMPVEVDGEEMMFSDLLVLWSIDGSYEDIIRAETKKIFDEIYGTEYRMIFISGERRLDINKGSFYSTIEMVVPIPTQNMPFQNKQIKVVLDYGQRKYGDIDLKR